MNLFRKKFDFQKDNLIIKFDLVSKQYIFINGNCRCDYSDLNRKSKKILKKENLRLKTDFNLLNEEIQKETNRRKQIETIIQKRNFFYSKGIELDGFEALCELPKNTISSEMNKFLDQLISKENFILGIHRTGYAGYKAIQRILFQGLDISSHLSSGVINGKIKISDNISFYSDNNTIKKELVYANSYKHSKGSILIAIPIKDLDHDLFVLNPSNTIPSLNPKYIIGFVPTDGKYIDRIITATDFKNYQENSEIINPTFNNFNLNNYEILEDEDYEETAKIKM